MKAFANSEPRLARAGLSASLFATLVLAACSHATKPEATPPPRHEQPAADNSKASPEQRFSDALQQMKDGQLADAEKAFTALTKDYPSFSGPWTNLGILYAKSKRRDAALSAFTRAVQLKSDNAVAWDWLGVLSREAGNYSSAQNAYEQALRADPNDPLIHLNYGILLDVYLKRPQDAIAQYQQYQKLLGKEDLRTQAWVAELQAKTQPAPAAAGDKP